MAGIEVCWLDSPAPYMPVWQAMRKYTEQRNEHTPDQLWLLEHAPVFTLGQAGRTEHILNPHDIPVVHCNRGGQVTYHGPGQLLMYTLVDLRRQQVYAREFVRLLEQSVLDVLADMGLDCACRMPGAPGIYVPQHALQPPCGNGLAKLAAIGIKISNGRAYHGVALNVAMDLQPFTCINPCGHAGLQTVDLQACGIRVDTRSIGNMLTQAFMAAWQAARP